MRTRTLIDDLLVLTIIGAFLSILITGIIIKVNRPSYKKLSQNELNQVTVQMADEMSLLKRQVGNLQLELAHLKK